MAKFIRTKDTIFEVVDETPIVYKVRAKGNPSNIYSKSKCQTTVIDYADSVLPLCDELVAVFDSNVRPVPCGSSILMAKGYAGKNGHIKGAIWTDKGLIYVAKMNEKGELELL